MVEIIITSIIAPIVPTVLAYFMGRKIRQKKEEVNIEKLQGKNYKTYVEAYQMMMSDMKGRLEESLAASSRQRKYYHKKLDELKDTIECLSESNKKLHEDIKQLKKDYPCPDCAIKTPTPCEK